MELGLACMGLLESHVESQAILGTKACFPFFIKLRHMLHVAHSHSPKTLKQTLDMIWSKTKSPIILPKSRNIPSPRLDTQWPKKETLASIGKGDM